MDFPLPAWVLEVEDHIRREHARRRFMVRLAALYHSETGGVKKLSVSSGLAVATLSNIMMIDRVTADTAIALEGLVGADLFPRSTFRPDLFGSEK